MLCQPPLVPFLLVAVKRLCLGLPLPEAFTLNSIALDLWELQADRLMTFSGSSILFKRSLQRSRFWPSGPKP